MKEQVKSKLIAILNEKFTLETDEVNDDSHLKDDLGLDSLDEVEFVMKIEKEFNITVDDDKVLEFKRLSEYVEYIETLVD